MMTKKKPRDPMTERVTVRMTENDAALVQDAAAISSKKAGTNPATAIRQALLRWARGVEAASAAADKLHW